ncbi:MAG: Ig-like domain-containing protein, partial [Candidatus Eremiobacterota bacterium]
MRHRLSILLLLAVLAAACGEDSVTTAVGGGTAQGPTGTVVVRLVLQSRAVPAVITHLRFYGLDAAGNFTFGPIVQPRAVTHTLTGVPTSTVTLRIEYLQNGVVRGLGSPPVQVPANGTVEVVDPPFEDVGDTVQRLEITPLAPRVPAGVGAAFQATVVRFDGTQQDVTSSVQWTSSNATVASIGNTPGTYGMARTLAAGSTTVTATFGSFTDSTVLTVTGATLTRIVVGPNNPVIGAGSSLQFTASGIFSDASSHNLTAQVTWTSANPAVAAIQNTPGHNGLATAVGPGPTLIAATHPGTGLADTTLLTVTASQLTRLEVTPGAALLPVGLTRGFDALAIYADGTKVDVTSSAIWTSSDGTVASVSNAPGSFGRATALAQGQANITAAFQGLTASGQLTVTGA